MKRTTFIRSRMQDYQQKLNQIEDTRRSEMSKRFFERSYWLLQFLFIEETKYRLLLEELENVLKVDQEHYEYENEAQSL